MSQSAIPQYHEKRLSLQELDHQFTEYIGAASVIDIGETLRVMLGDYFYGEPPSTSKPHYTVEDRTLVFPFFTTGGIAPQGPVVPLNQQELAGAIEALGEIFWSLADMITHRALMVQLPGNQAYNHRPNECLYKFYPETRDLVIYTPVLQGVTYPGFVPLDGRAVITGCLGYLPSWLASAFPST
jgi:hypothetical protein